ncbi:unnamed protein product [Prunus armeniaca]|uniref:Uncharacterized protein n=1 Tax=Prunus armeniaca TaxID=36596 RepID=A0A6J5W905_PRUAR|nr:unnamed protein product [Prunus armeniaca]
MSTLEASTVLHSHSSPTSVLASILHLTIASLPSSPSTAAPVPSSSNHQPPATATTPPPFSLSLARALDFSLSNTHSALPQFVCFGCFPFWVEVFAGAKLISGQYVCLCSDFQVLQSANHVSGDFIIKMPMLTAPSTIVSSPILPAGNKVLYNCFLDCLVALPIAARQQIAVVSLFFEVLDSFFDYSLAKSDYA